MITGSKKSCIIMCSLFIAASLLLTLAGTLNRRLLQQREAAHLTQAPPTQNMPPAVAFTTIALGGFRGILADVLWMRAGSLQDDGRYFELVQLADWIVRLQPRSPSIWAYHAWNMAYNLSALMPTPAEKWRWVHHGLRLLRDEGLHLNPGSAQLYQELAWLYLHKLGANYDTAADYYRQQWAAEVAAGRAPLDPETVQRLEATFGPLDWQTPQAHAIYWASTGLAFARTDFEDLALRRLVYQALLQRIQLGERQWLPITTAYVEDTRQRHPHIDALSHVLDVLRQQE